VKRKLYLSDSYTELSALFVFDKASETLCVLKSSSFALIMAFLFSQHKEQGCDSAVLFSLNYNCMS